ncbi:hypothetical protein ACFP3U_00455 [Kitasatospora misakiensis]|uniref:Aminotransferase n=1 Tax=Kitasatospora misakiensis TaxID=67330 RepID=A0ABW0WXQ4_9ACTN
MRDVRGAGHLYGVELAPDLLWPLLRRTEECGVFLYPFTGAGDPKSEGLVVAPPLTSTEEHLEFLTAALTDAVRTLS